MQVVHVLGDDAGEIPFGLQLRQGIVGRVGPGPADGVVHLLEELPDFGRVPAKGPDMGVFHGIVAVPQAAAPRKLGMPDSTEIPAPVRAATRGRRRMSAASSRGISFPVAVMWAVPLLWAAAPARPADAQSFLEKR